MKAICFNAEVAKDAEGTGKLGKGKLYLQHPSFRNSRPVRECPESSRFCLPVIASHAVSVMRSDPGYNKGDVFFTIESLRQAEES